MKIQRSDGFVVQTGDPDGKAVGYTGGKPSKSIGAGPNGERLIPTEIFVRGDDGPFYESTIEDEGRGGEATILPFSSYGAMGWARDEYDVNSGSSQFFWLLFDSQPSDRKSPFDRIQSFEVSLPRPLQKRPQGLILA